MDQFRGPQLSYWEKDVFLPPFDFVVLGAGIVGLNAALHLRSRAAEAKIAVVERGSLPAGASTRNAGFACIGSMTELLDDLSHMPENELWALVEKRHRGLERLKEKLSPQAIDYQHLGGYELFRAQDEKLFNRCMEKMKDFNRHMKSITGLPQTFTLADEDLKITGLAKVRHLIKNAAEGQLHPGKMINKLLQLCRQANIDIINGLEVIQLDRENGQVKIQTRTGWEITASHVIVATNGFARTLLPELELKPARNQVLITAPIPGFRLKACYHYDQGYFYFRNAEAATWIPPPKPPPNLIRLSKYRRPC